MSKIMRHVMIDLETMGLTPECAIVSIGAVKFDPRKGVVSKDTFYVELDYKTQDRRICPKTEAWWSTQGYEARAALDGIDDLEDALSDLVKWLPPSAEVWGNGAAFDISMLENAYRQHNMETPWKFWDVRDCRTIKAMYECSRGGVGGNNFEGIAHNAKDDAIHQAKWVSMMWTKMIGRMK